MRWCQGDAQGEKREVRGGERDRDRRRAPESTVDGGGFRGMVSSVAGQPLGGSGAYKNAVDRIKSPKNRR